MHESQRLINHVALVLDGSSSMDRHTWSLIKVADEQIRHLALRSEEMKQETRVSVYLFADRVECLIFDMDVMRLPSIKDLYKSYGMTALIDATLKSQEDLRTTSQIYGDHAFLTFVLTDGAENRSSNPWTELARLLDDLQENWTVAFLVPDSTGVAYMQRLGAPDGNIAQWNKASATGVVDAVKTIRTATDNFMTGRARGVRGTRDVFSTGIDAVNPQTVKSNLKPLDYSDYKLFDVPWDARIDSFVTGATNRHYVPGNSYYQLTKRETIQPYKEVVVVDKSNGRAYAGPHARALVGLPGHVVKVHPDDNPKYDIFIQSTSLNRKLIKGTKVLVKV